MHHIDAGYFFIKLSNLAKQDLTFDKTLPCILSDKTYLFMNNNPAEATFG